LENEITELISSLKLKKGANQTGSVVEFNDLKEMLLAVQHELWKEKLTNEALQTAHSRADMALAASLSVQQERADCIEQEYILASLKIKQLEESLRFVDPSLLLVPVPDSLSCIALSDSLIAANEEISSSPGKMHLERHNEVVNKSYEGNVGGPPSPSPSGFLTPTKNEHSNSLKLTPLDLVVNIPRSALKLPLASEHQRGSSSEIYPPISSENILQELIHSKLLLASVATELQEEKHLVNVLSKANQRYAEKVMFLPHLLKLSSLLLLVFFLSMHLTHTCVCSWQS
jgi:hypothetical protein